MMHCHIFLHKFSPIPFVLFLLEFLFCYFSAGMAARASNNNNLDGDDGQPNAPIQQRIVSPSTEMIVPDAAGKGGRADTGRETEVVEKSSSAMSPS
jgi:hypothetical protein